MLRFYHRTMLLVLCFGPWFGYGQTMDQELMIPVENSRLYVRLIGNSNGPIILNLHGGPGAFSGFDHEFNRHYLEEDYLVAYLDQRGGGKSDICLDSTMLNMDQFVLDLDVVVDSLRNRFPGKPIDLIGASWGGTLGLLYMIEHQDKIQAYACVSGKADGKYPIYALIEHEQTLAQKLLSNARTRTDSTKYQHILLRLSQIENQEFNDFFEEVNLLKHTFPKDLGFNAYWSNKEALILASKLGEDPAYFERAHYTKKEFEEAIAKSEYVNRVFRNDSAYNHLNILEEIDVIHKPVLVVQGEDDYVIGQQQARMIYDALVASKEKQIRIIENASHNLNMESPVEYYCLVKSFFDSFRYN